MDVIKLFWGLVVLIFGGVLLSVNQGWLNSSIWPPIFALWPIILVVLGLKLLVNNEKILSVLTVGIVLLAIIFVALTYNQENENLFGNWNMPNMKINNQTYSESLTDTFDSKIIKNAGIKLSTGAVNLSIQSLPEDAVTETLYQIKTVDMGKINIKKTVTDNKVLLEISESQPNVHFIQPTLERQLDIYLPESLMAELKIDSGASKINLNYSKLNVTASDINIGASSGDIYLGDNVASQSLDIDAGASNIVFHVPETLGISATLEGGLNNISTDPSLEIEKSDDRYITKYFATKKSQIIIVGTTGVSNIRFKAE